MLLIPESTENFISNKFQNSEILAIVGAITVEFGLQHLCSTELSLRSVICCAVNYCSAPESLEGVVSERLAVLASYTVVVVLTSFRLIVCTATNKQLLKSVGCVSGNQNLFLLLSSPDLFPLPYLFATAVCIPLLSFPFFHAPPFPPFACLPSWGLGTETQWTGIPHMTP